MGEQEDIATVAVQVIDEIKAYFIPNDSGSYSDLSGFGDMKIINNTDGTVTISHGLGTSGGMQLAYLLIGA